MTLRELATMAETRGRFEWSQTASMLSVIIGIVHDPKKGQAPTPEELNPFTVKRKNDKKKLPKAPLSMLKDLFVKEKK